MGLHRLEFAKVILLASDFVDTLMDLLVNEFDIAGVSDNMWMSIGIGFFRY